MHESSERILTTHVGRLAHSPELNEALQGGTAGQRAETEDFERDLRTRVADAVAYQANLGINIVNDGEVGKLGWQAYAQHRLSGLREAREGEPVAFDQRDSKDWRDFSEYYAGQANSWMYERWRAAQSRSRLVCDGPIEYVGHAEAQHDIENLLRALADAGRSPSDGFMNATSPSSILATDRYYGDEQAYLFALSDALNMEYRAIVDAGLTLQLDDPILVDQEFDYGSPSGLRTYHEWAELRVEAVNRSLRGIAREQTRLHVCWGSWRGPHSTDLPMEHVIPVLTKLDVGGWSVEAGNARHEHEFAAWHGVDLDARVLLPGVVSHATDTVEHPDLVAMRIELWAGAVGRENVIASTDCGLGDRVHPTIERAKLAALAEGARIASQRLWGPSRSRRGDVEVVGGADSYAAR